MNRILSLFALTCIFAVNACAQKTVFVKIYAGDAYYKVITINPKDTKTEYYYKKVADAQTLYEYGNAASLSQSQYDSIEEEEFTMNDKDDAYKIIEYYYGRLHQDAKDMYQTAPYWKYNTFYPGAKGFIEADYLIGTGDYKNYNRIGLSATVGYQCNSSFFIGVGVGAEYDYENKKTNLPVFADLRIGSINSVFLDAKMGYSVNIDKEAIKGYFANPSIGFRIPLDEKTGLSIGVGYHLIFDKIEMPKNNYYSSESYKYFYCHSVQLKLGIDF